MFFSIQDYSDIHRPASSRLLKHQFKDSNRFEGSRIAQASTENSVSNVSNVQKRCESFKHSDGIGKLTNPFTTQMLHAKRFFALPELFDRLLCVLCPLCQVGQSLLCGFHITQHRLGAFVPQTPGLPRCMCFSFIKLD